jgi:hypothetical protein
MLQKEDQDGTKIALPVQLLILVSCVAAICLSVEPCASQHCTAPSTFTAGWLASDLSQITTAQSLAYHRNIIITGLQIYNDLVPSPSKDSGKYVYHLI